jgi:1,4-dihydroxy-2-naphthoyl-CoA hydrolase
MLSHFPFTDHYTVRFQDTDGAGVVFFANALGFCHAAYEAALVAQGIDLPMFFHNPTTAVPIVHATVDFRQPMQVGDVISIQLTPQQLKDSEFEIHYQILAGDRTLCTALTRHVSIDPVARIRKPLPPALLAWLQIPLG